MKLFELFKKKATREIAPQFTRWERQAFARPQAVAGALPVATYAAMERDAMVQTALTVKKLGVLAAPWTVEPADESKPAQDRAEFIERAFDRMEGSPLTLMDGAMDAFAKGWSVQEMIFEQEAGKWWLRAAKPKDPALFGQEVDRFGNVTGLRLEIAGEPAIDLPASKFVVYRNRAAYGTPRGKSDLDAAYLHWTAKSALLTAWQAHLERFASPSMMASYGSTISEEDRSTLLNSLTSLRASTAIAFPSEIEVSTIGGSSEASKGFIEAIEFHNREIARSILGQTLTTDEGRRVGSLALGKVHLQVLVLQLQAIRQELADRVMTEQVIRPLVELNFGPGLVPRFAFEDIRSEAFRSGRLD